MDIALVLGLLAALLIGLLLGAALGWYARGQSARAGGQDAAHALEPIGQALTALNAAVVGAARDEAAARSALSEQLRELSTSSLRSAAGLQRETRRLVGALSRSDVRGRWGEMQLRRLFETSGLRPGIHYQEQPVVTSDGAAVLRPDAVVFLGADQTVVIDAKVSLAAFLRAEAMDPGPEQETALAEHTAEVAAHVSRLAAKEYWRAFPTAPDFVVLFLPAEALLAEALSRDPNLLESAFARNVILATPTTLQAMLRTVAHVRRNEAVAENARIIGELGRELHERLLGMVGHLDRIGAALGSAVTAYNRSVGSFESRVLVTARRFSELNGQEAAPPTPRTVELPSRWAGGAPPEPGEHEVSVELNTPFSGYGTVTSQLPAGGSSITIREPAPTWNQ